MHVRYSLLASQATTAIFVLLWGSAAIFTRWGLDNASPMALLVFSFSDCPGRAGAADHRPSALAARAGHPPADSGHRPDADWRLFGLLLRGDG
ncbi:drug/metabolite transporter permease [Klebsiella variicola]|nr:drug/metabolite transporter permease [Klebsiella variicola]